MPTKIVFFKCRAVSICRTCLSLSVSVAGKTDRGKRNPRVAQLLQRDGCCQKVIIFLEVQWYLLVIFTTDSKNLVLPLTVR